MKKEIILFLILLTLISSCSQKSNQELIILQQKIAEQEKEINLLKLQIDSLEKEQESFQPRKTGPWMNLQHWSIDDTVRALAIKNPKFKNATWFQYEYTNEGYYYDLVGPIFPVDPFYKIAYDLRDRELTVNSLRIFDIDPKRNDNEEEYTNYVETINKENILDPRLVCKEQTDCRNINFITCNSKGQILYAWYVYPYLFVTRNDAGETYESFKEFYCTEEYFNF